VRGVPAALLVLLSAGAGGVESADPCSGFSWNVTRERAVFKEAPQKIAAGASPADAPVISPDRLYELALVPYSQVRFATTPGRNRSAEGRAGLATLSLSTGGVYRIALDQPFWVDVIAQGSPIHSRDFQGRAGCHAPHKVVEFSLPAATPLTLQFSAGDATTVRVAVLMAPPAL